jgi:alpha-1,2-glucosyltransferase
VPFLFPTAFLLYTDSLSLLTALLAHALTLRCGQQEAEQKAGKGRSRLSVRRCIVAAAAWGCAILCRQTNAVWAAFAAALLGLSALDKAALRQLTRSTSRAHHRHGARPSLASECAALAGLLPEALGGLAPMLGPFLAVLGAFVSFVVFLNEGAIVVGDKKHHHPAFHPTQMLYLFAVAGGMVTPALLVAVTPALLVAVTRRCRRSHASEDAAEAHNPAPAPVPAPASDTANADDGQRAQSTVARTLDGRWLCVLDAFARGPRDAYRRRVVFVPVGALLVPLLVAFFSYIAGTGTVVHPYLIGDNRHYTFYLWGRVLGRYRELRLVALPIAAALGAVLVAVRLWLSARSLPNTGGGSAALAASEQGLFRGPHRRMLALLLTLGWVVASALVLVPAALVEPRYFIVPLCFLALHLRWDNEFSARKGASGAPRRTDRLALQLTVAVQLLFDALLVFVFLKRTFQRPDGSVGRFLW